MSFWKSALGGMIGLSLGGPIGALIGAKLGDHIGVFIEGSKLKYYGREEYTISTGINWRF